MPLYRPNRLTILLFFAVFALFSCHFELPITPVFTKEFTAIQQEIGITGHFAKVGVTVSRSQLLEKEAMNVLTLLLINGKDLPATQEGLDSLAKVNALILKQAIKNSRDYRRITVIIENSTHNGIVETSNQNQFVYLVKELN
ncbi:hypothetical protein ACX0G9_26490 [Flavitalea flava]